MPIATLPAAVAARIAAGEVIERPASVVKELVENALDAGARRITVALRGGGIERIEVADDGCGIAAAEVELAFARYATSKLRSDDDLAHLSTFGFRGEALPSIAAVADVALTTRTADATGGVRLTLRDGLVIERRPLGRPVGTTVEVRDLFSRLPARRKYLRSASTEAALVVQLVGQMALACPEVAFTLAVDGKPVLSTDGSGDRARAALAVLGQKVSRDLVPVDWSAPDDWPATVRVRGLAGHRAAHRPNRSGISLFVNRRLIQSRALTTAVEEAYRTLIPTGRHPIVVLDLEVDPAEVDVNVHPAKAEVRLLRERAVFGAVQRALHEALARAGVARGWAGAEVDGQDSAQEPQLRGLRVLGQVSQTYIIAEGEAGLYLVDQHAAHERVLYEELRLAQLAGQRAQLLLEPISLELDPATVALAEAHRADLTLAGFEVEPFGSSTVLVRSIPALSRQVDPVRFAQEVLIALGEAGPADDWRERLRILASCKAAVRAGDPLTPEEMLGLLERLGEKELCRTCSHGRPTALLLSHRQLEQEFGRR